MKTLLRLFLAAITVAVSSSHADAALYAATASGAAGRLYRLNPDTGAVIQDIGPLEDQFGINYPMTGLAFHPATGVLYGSTGNNPADTAATFVTIDPATAAVTVIGNFNAGPTNGQGTPSTMTDLAFDSAGNLYGIGSIGGPQLYSINIATGQATVIGGTGFTSTTGGGLAISSAGVFYGTPTASRYGTYNSVTGAFTEILNPITRPGGGGAYAALDFSPAGVLYAMNSAPGSPPPAFLATIDPTTGAVTNIGQSGFSFDAIAFQVPEPAAATLVAASGIMLASARRRRLV